MTCWYLLVLLYSFEVYFIDYFKRIDKFTEVLNFNRLFFKLNWFICNSQIVFFGHSSKFMNLPTHVTGVYNQFHESFELLCGSSKPNLTCGTLEFHGSGPLPWATSWIFQTKQFWCFQLLASSFRILCFSVCNIWLLVRVVVLGLKV